jgi:hypothetical protein
VFTRNVWLVVSYRYCPTSILVICALVKFALRCGLPVTAVFAIDTAAGRLLKLTPSLLLSVRVPTSAATSAAFWLCVRETANTPRSMASATNANSPMRHTPSIGSTVPGRDGRRLARMGNGSGRKLRHYLMCGT